MDARRTTSRRGWIVSALLLIAVLTGAASACTTAIISGLATRDHRPLLWKNRDVDPAGQKLVFDDSGPIPFIAVTYQTDTNTAYMGINLEGFAIGNADIYNVSGGHPAHVDGYTMRWALSHCRDIFDFEAWLDSTNLTGGRWVCNYNVFDAFGHAGYFEVADTYYTYFDATDTLVAPTGWLVRANFAVSGSFSWSGLERYQRARDLLQHAERVDSVDVPYLIDHCARDLHSPDVDPYPLPYSALVPAVNTICRYATKSAVVIQGVAPGEDPHRAILWAILGSPSVTPAIPCWVQAGAVPDLTNDPAGAPWNVQARAYRTAIWQGTVIDTRRLVNDMHTGLLDRVHDIDDWLQSQVAAFMMDWTTAAPSRSMLANFQNTLSVEAFHLYAGRFLLSADDPALPQVGDPLVAPNPSRDGRITLTWRTPPPPGSRLEVRVTDVLGQEVLRQSLHATGGPVISFELPDRPGAYLLELSSGQTVTRERVIRLP